MAAALVHKLGMSGPAPCALAGGALLGGNGLRQAFQESVQGLGVELDPVTEVMEPAQGALLLARRLIEAKK
jgi:hypothetical protein